MAHKKVAKVTPESAKLQYEAFITEKAKEFSPMLHDAFKTETSLLIAIDNTTQLTLQGLVALNVQKGAVVNTDEFRGYGDLSEKGYVHNRVNHSAKLYVDGKAYTNGIESVWSLVKRGFYGTFHKFTLEHLQRYVDEFDFRWNEGNCKVPTDERISSLIGGCWGKSLDYKTLVA